MNIRTPRDEDGFTLIELIIATAVSGLVMAGVAGMLSAIMLNAGATEGRMSQTHDAQSAAAYFAQDVNAMGVRNWTDDARPLQQSAETNGGRFPCGPAGTQLLIRMAWDEFDPAAPATPRRVVVAYVVSGLQLHRILCRAGSPPSDRVLVSSLSASPAPTVACTTSCSANSPPAGITITVSVHDPKNKITDYRLTLSGHRMQT